MQRRNSRQRYSSNKETAERAPRRSHEKGEFYERWRFLPAKQKEIWLTGRFRPIELECNDGEGDLLGSLEAAITKTLGQAGLPVTKYFEAVTVENLRGIVLQRIEGISLMARMMRAPLRFGECVKLMADLRLQCIQSREQVYHR